MSALAEADRSVLSFMAQSIEIQQQNEWDNHSIFGTFPKTIFHCPMAPGGILAFLQLVSSPSSPLTSWFGGKNNKQIGALKKKRGSRQY
jgi:hypothetical protein